MGESAPSVDVSLIPDGLAAEIERQTDATIIGIIPRAGGGASRSGARIDLRHNATGDVLSGYLAFDDRGDDPERQERFARETAIFSSLPARPQLGVHVPRLLASSPDRLALLTGFVPGEARFAGFQDSAERETVARDFMAQLAALHRIDVRSLALPGFGDTDLSNADRIRSQLKALRQRNLEANPDAVLLLAIDWAERNVPTDNGPSVLVHGDAGPGNFMHQNGKVTALIDWELVHYGDPAEDLAQIWVRSLFQPFIEPRAMLDYYVAAGGAELDLARIEYHRLLFQLSFTVNRQASFDGFGPPPGHIGNNMLYHTIHMRIIVEELARLTGVSLSVPSLPDCPEPPSARSFDVALADLRDVIVPRSTDEQAAVKAKSLARMVKYWRQRDRFGAAFDGEERDEISAALGRSFAGLADARRAFAQAVHDQALPWEQALTICHGRVMRETELMGDALGTLKTCRYAALA